MALTHLIDEHFDPKPQILGDNYIIEFAIAFDTAQMLFAQERVMLAKLSGRPNGEYDFQFGIFETILSGGKFVPGPTDFSHSAVKKYIRKIDRPRVKACVCKAAGHLIDEAKPTRITMHTDTPRLPPDGLPKYDAISALFVSKGFELELETDAIDGRRYWSFNRK